MAMPPTDREFFRFGLDTAEIARRTERTEAEVYNDGMYRKPAEHQVRPSVEFYPRKRGPFIERPKPWDVRS